MKTIKFIDFFAGIGGFHSGMQLAGHECVGYVEWDRFARQSYQAIYNTEGVYSANDISQIGNGGELPQADVWCFGSPCTNISIAGNREGIHGESSAMFFEVMRLLNDRSEVYKPAYLFMENVKNLLSSNGGRDFAEVLLQMDKAGYDVEWQVCNSKEVVPQNRERIFIIGHKRGRTTRRVFPLDIKPYATQYRILSDVLEDNVDEKYYLSDDKVKQLVVNAQKDGSKKRSLKASNNNERADQVKQIGNTVKTNSFGGNPQRGRVYDDKGLAPTLNTMQGGGLEPKILVKNATKQGYLEGKYGDGVDLAYPSLTPDRVNKRQNGRRFKNNEDPMFTVTAADRHGVAIKNPTITQELRIRKLTPLECWRLQGFTDEQFEKAKNAGVSDSQLYKQAGNAVTIPVIHAIADKFKVLDND